MNGTSSVSDLQTRLQKRAEQERIEVEAVIQNELKKLSENLNRIVKRELNTIESNTKTWSGRLSAAALKAWSRPIGVGLLLFLGICGGSWGLTRWLSNNIQNLIETKAELQLDIKEQRQTVERLKETTWGVYLRKGEKGRFLVLPKGMKPQTGWTVGGRPAVKLSSE